MKRLKRIMALVIAMAMVLSMMSMAAFAANTNPENDPPTSTGDVSGSITVENPQKVNGSASTYTAYKIFDVTYANGAAGATASTDLYAYTITNTSATNDWFDVIIPNMTASADGNTYTGTAGTGYEGLVFTKTAGDANKYSVTTTDKFNAPKFAKALNEISSKPSPDASIDTADGDTLKATGLDLGYWFVTTTTGSLCNLTTTHPDEIIYDKNEVPNVDKSILEDVDETEAGDEEIKNNNAAIGDVVKFKMDTKVPSMVGYDSYSFVVKDTFSKGLTLVDAQDASSATSVNGGKFYAGNDTTNKYYGKNSITVTLDAGNPAGSHPAKTLTRVYLNPADGEYYKDSAFTLKLTTTTYDATTGKRTGRTLNADNAGGLTLDDDGNLQYCYYVKTVEVTSDGQVLNNLVGNYNPPNGVDSVNRQDTANKGETRMEIVFVDMIQYLDQTNGTDNAAAYTQTSEGTLGSADALLGYTGKGIHITYFAEVDEDAVVNDEGGNPNTAKITYSNDPTNTGHGDKTPDEPGPNSPTGDSPESKTNTFVTGIKLTKIDNDDTAKKLAGAKFELKNTTAADNLLNTVIQNGVRYEKKGYVLKQINSNTPGESVDATSAIVYAKEEWADGDSSDYYYLLKDGTYTTTAYTTENQNLYATPLDDVYVKVKYTWVVNTNYKENGAALTAAEQAALTEAQKHISTTGADGIISFAGLKAGKYTLTELQAPDGYNVMTDDITIEIKAEYKTSADTTILATDDENTAVKCVWTAIVNGGGFTGEEISLEELDDTTHSQDVLKLLAFNVANNKGKILPSTGGIGTTIFYVVGAMLVIGAGVILITRRRMDA